jgi:hypothetical protein
MNCKPGDLAIIVRSRYVGRIVVVKTLEPNYQFWEFSADSWRTEPILRDLLGREVPCPDSYLRPIIDPGEDAQDETLSWLDVPSAEKVDA